MKVNQEDFDRLNQLDRIEFRQVENLIEKKYPANNFVFFISFFGMLLLFLMSFLVIMKFLDYETFMFLIRRLYFLRIVVLATALFKHRGSYLYRWS